MVFFSSFVSKLEKEGLEMKYGITRPRDAHRVLCNIVESNFRSEEEKVSLAKPVLSWLSRLSLQGNDEATNVLEYFRDTDEDFLKRNNIHI